MKKLLFKIKDNTLVIKEKIKLSTNYKNLLNGNSFNMEEYSHGQKGREEFNKERKKQNGKRKSRGIAGSLGRDFSVREFPVCCPGTMPRSLFFSGRPFLCARPSP